MPRVLVPRFTPLFTPLLVVVLLVAAACTFERRPDRAGADDHAEQASLLPDSGRVLSPADSVLLVAQLYRDALDVGDLSRALSYLHPGAALFNDAAALLPVGSSAGEVLLQELRLRQEGLRFVLIDAETTLLGDAALVVKRYRVLGPGTDVEAGADEGPDGAEADLEDAPVALETTVLVRGPAGWRIRHLHRSAAGAP